MNTDIKKFKEELHNREVNFSYKKKNGEERTARGTLNMDIYGEDNKPLGNTDYKPSDTTIRYYDLNSEGWRSFVVENFIGFEDD
jgi:hypothetical protein